MFKLKQMAGAAGLAASLALGLALPATAAPISVNVVGAPAAVMAGDIFDVEIVVSGITDEFITAWDIDVAFDEMLLSNDVVSLTSVPLMGGAASTIFDAFFDPGLTDTFVVSLVSDADIAALQCPGGICGPTFTLASLTFTALSDGTPTIELVNWGEFNDIKGANAEQIFPPTDIPEPGTLALAALALAGAGVAARRRRT